MKERSAPASHTRCLVAFQFRIGDQRAHTGNANLPAMSMPAKCIMHSSRVIEIKIARQMQKRDDKPVSRRARYEFQQSVLVYSRIVDANQANTGLLEITRFVAQHVITDILQGANERIDVAGALRRRSPFLVDPAYDLVEHRVFVIVMIAQNGIGTQFWFSR